MDSERARQLAGTSAAARRDSTASGRCPGLSSPSKRTTMMSHCHHLWRLRRDVIVGIIPGAPLDPGGRPSGIAVTLRFDAAGPQASDARSPASNATARRQSKANPRFEGRADHAATKARHGSVQILPEAIDRDAAADVRDITLPGLFQVSCGAATVLRSASSSENHGRVEYDRDIRHHTYLVVTSQLLNLVGRSSLGTENIPLSRYGLR